MATKRAPGSVVEDIFREAIANPHAGAIVIHRKIVGEGGLPSVRTVGNWIAEARALSNADKAKYRLAVWPTAFGTEALPWVAGAAVGELTAILERTPTIPVAVWFYRVTLAAPALDASERRAAAVRLADAEAAGDVDRLHEIGAEVLRGGVERIRPTASQVRFLIDFVGAQGKGMPADEAARHAVALEEQREKEDQELIDRLTDGSTR